MRVKRGFVRVLSRSMRLRSLFFAVVMLGSFEAQGANPLVVDDADTVDPRHLQLNAGWRFSRRGSAWVNVVAVNPVLGLTARGEIGGAFGYEWRDAGDGPDRETADGVSDVLLSTKWRLWESEAGFKLSARLDVKLPAASEARGLGAGDTDVGGVLVATRCFGGTCLDWNIGYIAADVSHSFFGDDAWFLGQAVRQTLSERWTLLGEIYGLVPNGAEGPSAEVRFNAGPQLAVRENFLVSALIGSAAGRGSPDLTGYLGFTWVF